MSDGAGVFVDLIIVAALVCLVAEEMDGSVLDTAGQVLLVFNMLQAVGLVPATWEDVKGNLTADRVAAQQVSVEANNVWEALGTQSGQSGEKHVRTGKDSRQAQIWKGSGNVLDKLLANAVLEIVFLILIPLFNACVPADWADVDHAVPELDKSTALLWDVEVGDVVEDELDELLVWGFADPLDEAVRGQRSTHAVSRQAILSEAEVEE